MFLTSALGAAGWLDWSHCRIVVTEHDKRKTESPNSNIYFTTFPSWTNRIIMISALLWGIVTGYWLDGLVIGDLILAQTTALSFLHSVQPIHLCGSLSFSYNSTEAFSRGAKRPNSGFDNSPSSISEIKIRQCIISLSPETHIFKAWCLVT